METLQEYQAGVLERVENFPRGGIPEWVEAQVLLHEVDSLERYGYPIEGMGVGDYAALVAAVTPPWHAAKTPVEEREVPLLMVDCANISKEYSTDSAAEFKWVTE